MRFLKISPMQKMIYVIFYETNVVVREGLIYLPDENSCMIVSRSSGVRATVGFR